MDIASWTAAATGIVGTARSLLRPYGLAIDERLRVEADTHPCPGYLHDELVIAFCPPVVEGNVDRLRWLMLCRTMGCGHIDEAREFYRLALPFIVCHELGHHLRHAAGLDSQSPFVEEQVCDRIAAAMVEAMPEHRHTLRALAPLCRTMRGRLARDYATSAATAYLPSVADQLAASLAVDAHTLGQLRGLSRENELSLVELLRLAPQVSREQVSAAIADRRRARRRLDGHYTNDPAEYWYFCLVWMETYFDRGEPLTLAEAVREHLRSDAGESHDDEVEMCAASLLARPDGLGSPASTRGGGAAIRELAASCLLELGGAAALPTIVDNVEQGDDPTRERLLWALARQWQPGWPAGDIGAVVAAGLGGPPRVVAATLRLCARAGIEHDEATLARLCERRLDLRDSDQRPLWIELLAERLVAPGPEWRRLSRMRSLLDPALEAWAARGHPLGELGPLPALLPMARGEVRARLLAGATVADLVACLPARGTPDYDEAAALLQGRGVTTADLDPSGPLPRRLRIAAARADLLGDRGPLDDAVEAYLARARRLLSTRDAVDPAEPFAALATSQLATYARRLALDVVVATARADQAHTAARLARVARRHGEVEPLVIDLVARAAPEHRRAALLALLAGRLDTPSPAATHDELSPLLRALLLEASSTMASTMEITLHLASVPMFAQVDPERLWRVAELCTVREHAAGESIFAEGEPGHELYVLVKGAVAVEQGPEHTRIAELHAPAVIGEMSVFEASTRSAGARALEDCRLVALSGDDLKKVGRAMPRVYEAILAALAARLRRANRPARERPDG